MLDKKRAIMEIKAFKAYRFNEAVVGNAGSCIAPPYDVIDDNLREKLYQKSKYNIVQITKGKSTPADSPDNNQYTRAAKLLNDWLASGAIKQDSKDTIYGYTQDFEMGGPSTGLRTRKKVQRISFVSLAKLEELGKGVLPHEYTLSKPKVDRLNLRKATKASFGLIFMLYNDNKNTVEKIIKKASKGKPLIDFVDEQNVRHRLYAIVDDVDVESITKMMGTKTCIIADGHHRYETALNYSKESSEPSAQYVLTAFVNSNQKGLLILATHRLIQNVKNFDSNKFLAEVAKDFEISKFVFTDNKTKQEAREKMLDKMKKEFDADNNAFGIYTGSGSFYTAVLKNKKAMDEASPNMSKHWKSLDVAVLHKLIIEKHLGIGEQGLAEGGNIEYVKDTGDGVDDSIKQVDGGEKQAALFVNPTKMRQIELVTSAGERMPQKSTFFFPKVYTGLVINKY